MLHVVHVLTAVFQVRARTTRWFETSMVTWSSQRTNVSANPSSQTYPALALTRWVQIVTEERKMFPGPFVSRLYAGSGSYNPQNCPTRSHLACAATEWHRAYCQSNHCTSQALTSYHRSVLLNWGGSVFYVKLFMFETLCFHRLSE